MNLCMYCEIYLHHRFYLFRSLAPMSKQFQLLRWEFQLQALTSWTDVWTLEVCLQQRSSKVMETTCEIWRSEGELCAPSPTPPSNGCNLNPQLFVGALWEMKFEGLIIWLHLLKNAWRVQFRLLWRRIWATLFKNPPFLGGWGVDKKWNVPKWSFQQISNILKLKMCF